MNIPDILTNNSTIQSILSPKLKSESFVSDGDAPVETRSENGNGEMRFSSELVLGESSSLFRYR